MIEILRCNEDTLVHASCEADNSNPDSPFKFLYPQQFQHLKSLLVFKHLLKGNEDTEAMVITLDTNQNGFFRKELETDYRLFLFEIATRLEYEFVVSAATMAAKGEVQ